MRKESLMACNTCTCIGDKTQFIHEPLKWHRTRKMLLEAAIESIVFSTFLLPTKPQDSNINKTGIPILQFSKYIPDAIIPLETRIRMNLLT